MYYERDPWNPRIMAETTADPSRLASPLDMQTEADRAREEQRRDLERLQAYQTGRVPFAATQARGLAPEAPGDILMTGLQDLTRIPGWFDIPLWRREAMMRAAGWRF